MMKKYVGAAAIVGVVGLIGGGTFAAWSDQHAEPVEIASGNLTLNVGEQSVTTPGDLNDLYPGATRTRNLYLSSNDSDSSPDGNLRFTIDNIEGEDSDGDPSTILADQVNVQVQVATEDNNGDPITDANTCAASQTGSYDRIVGGGPNTFTSLSSVEGDQIDVFEGLEPGQGVCFRMELTMPSVNSSRYDTGSGPNVTNASQDATGEFDLVFDLDQENF